MRRHGESRARGDERTATVGVAASAGHEPRDAGRLRGCYRSGAGVNPSRAPRDTREAATRACPARARTRALPARTSSRPLARAHTAGSSVHARSDRPRLHGVRGVVLDAVADRALRVGLLTDSAQPIGGVGALPVPAVDVRRDAVRPLLDLVAVRERARGGLDVRARTRGGVGLPLESEGSGELDDRSAVLGRSTLGGNDAGSSPPLSASIPQAVHGR